MQTLSFILGLTGTILEFIGFIGLYFHVDKFMTHISLSDIKFFSQHFGHEKSTSSSIKELMESEPNSFEIKKDKLKRIYFLSAVVGITCQLSSLIVSFSDNKSTNKTNNCTCHKGCKSNKYH